MKLLRNGAIAVAAAIGGLILWGLAGSIGRDVGRAAATAITRTASDASVPTEWTAEYVRKVAWPAARLKKELGFLVTDNDSEAVASCMTAKFIAAIPGGPREMQEIARREDGTLEKIAHRAGFECAQEFSARIAASPTWVPQFPPVYVLGCVRTNGEANLRWCECLAKEAPSQFVSPAAFMEAESAGNANTLTTADRKKIRRLVEKCFDLHVDVGDAR